MIEMLTFALICIAAAIVLIVLIDRLFTVRARKRKNSRGLNHEDR
jgi:hypothetical protein